MDNSKTRTALKSVAEEIKAPRVDAYSISGGSIDEAFERGFGWGVNHALHAVAEKLGVSVAEILPPKLKSDLDDDSVN